MTHVIFDWDGTLIRSLHLWIDGYALALERRGHVVAHQVVAQEFFHQHDTVAARHPHLDFDRVADEARRHVVTSVAEARLYDGARGLLEGLAAAGIGMGLVSSSPRAALERGLAAHRLEGFFSAVIAGDDGFGHKPDPGPFAEMLGRLGAVAAQTLIIGDSHVDILAGQALGCRTCWFAHEDNRLFHDFDVLAELGADHIVANLPDMAALL